MNWWRRLMGKRAQGECDNEKGCNTESTNSGLALHDAAKVGDVRAVRRLLKTSGDVNAFDHEGKTALWSSVDGGSVDVVKLLLENGADPTLMGKKDINTPLHLAALEDRADIVLLLLQSGADPNVKTWLLGNTPLHGAAKFGAVNAARALLENGAHINAVDDVNRTAFNEAQEQGDESMMELLREFGGGVRRYRIGRS